MPTAKRQITVMPDAALHAFSFSKHTHMLAFYCMAKTGSVVQVSDREYQTGKSTTPERLKTAERLMKEGKGEEILFRDDPVGTPICARRFASLASKHGDDDMFSSDFTDQELQVRICKFDSKSFCATCRFFCPVPVPCTTVSILIPLCWT